MSGHTLGEELARFVSMSSVAGTVGKVITTACAVR